MSVVGTLAVRIVGDSSHLNRTLNTSQASVKKFAMAAGAAMVAAAGTFAVFAKRAIDSMDEMSKMAQRAGVSVRAMSELSHAAQLSGLSVQQLSQTFGILSRRLVEAQQGSTAAQASFRALDLDPRQFQTADEALMAVAERFAAMPDGVEKTAAAAQLFGDRVGRQLLPFLNQGRDGLEELRKEAQRLGVAFDDEAGAAAEQFNDNLARISAVGRGVFYQIANAWLPTINRYAEGVFEASRQTGSWFRALSAVALGGIPASFTEFSEEIIKIENQIAKMDEAFAAFARGERVDDVALLGSTQSLQDRLRLLKTLAEMEEQRRNRLTMVTPDFPDVGGVSSQAKSDLEDRLEAVRRIASEFERERDFQLEIMRIRDDMVGMTRDEQEIQEAINNVLQSTSRNLQQIADQRLEAANLGASQTILDQFDKEAAKVQEMANRYVELAQIQKRAAIDAQRTFAFGWRTAFQQFAEDSTNSAMVARDMFSSMTNNISAAVDRLVRTGKLSFSDFASSIIQDIIRIQLQAQVSQAFSQIIGIVGSAIGSAFAGTSVGLGGATATGAGTTAGGAGAVAFPVSGATPVPARPFAMGGYTGHGGQFDPAGIVHRGEFVLNAAATRRIGVSNLENMNRGFAMGGYVGGSRGGGGMPAVEINVINQSSQPVTARQTAPQFDGERFVQTIVLEDIRRNGPIGQALRAGV